MASQTEFDDVSTLIETNNRLTKQLIEQFKLIAGKDQRYINVLQMHTERMRNQELKEILKQKENDIAESERIIQEFKDKNFCQDLIQLDGELKCLCAYAQANWLRLNQNRIELNEKKIVPGTVPTIDVESPSKGASDGVADDAAGAAANEALDLLQ